MDNKKMNITDLIQKYERMRYVNRKIYFDTEEFARLTKHYIFKKDTLEAERVVNIGLGMHSNSTELMILKAKALIASEKYEIAYDYLLTISESESNVDILLLKFECLHYLNRREEVDAFLDYNLKGELNDTEHYKFITELGYIYNDAERFETSIMLLEKALEIDSTNMDVLIELTYAYEMVDNIDKAIEITNAILDLNPYSFDGWVSLGRLYSYNCEYDLSIDAFDFALAIKESDVEVLKLKALTYNEDDNYEGELRLLNECLDVTPLDESLYESLLEKYQEYFGTDYHNEVLRVLRMKAENFGPKGVLLKIADIHLYWAEYEEAKEVYDRIPDEDKSTLEYYKLTGRFALHNDDNVSAEAVFMLALSEYPDDEEVLDYLSEINWDLDNYVKAAEYLERLIELNPEYSIVKFRMAYIRFEIGEKEPFDNILNQIEDEKELHMLLGMFSSYNGKRDKEDYTLLSREEIMIRMDEAREGWVQLKKSKE